MSALQEANKWMSLYIRLRDAIKWNNIFDEDLTGCDPKLLMAACVTCGVIKPWRTMDAGHFISRGSGGQSGVYFDERNVHIQCKVCNGFRQGATLEYQDFMLKKYGQEVIDELRRKDKIVHRRTSTELMAFALHYKQLYHELLGSL